MTEHPTITALRATAPHELSPLPWRVDDDEVSLDAVLCSTGLAVSIGSYDKDASYIAAAVNAAPHLLAEVDRLRAQLEALVGLVAKWDDGSHCCEWNENDGFLPCCFCDDAESARAEARRLLGVENG